jgi:hypothetical protein
MGNTLHNKIYLGRSLFSSRKLRVALVFAACGGVGLAIAVARAL